MKNKSDLYPNKFMQEDLSIPLLEDPLFADELNQIRLHLAEVGSIIVDYLEQLSEMAEKDFDEALASVALEWSDDSNKIHKLIKIVLDNS